MVVVVVVVVEGEPATGGIVETGLVVAVGSCEIAGRGTAVRAAAGMGGVISSFPGAAVVEFKTAGCGGLTGGGELKEVGFEATTGVLDTVVVTEVVVAGGEFGVIGERTAATGGVVSGGVVSGVATGGAETSGGTNPGAGTTSDVVGMGTVWKATGRTGVTTPTPPVDAGGSVTGLGNTGVLRLAGGTGLGSGRFTIVI